MLMVVPSGSGWRCATSATDRKVWTQVQSQEVNAMKIGQVAAGADVTIDTVRFYERRGLLPAPHRRPSGYREYPPSTVERIGLARALQSLGFTLDEIIEMLHAHDAGTATCDSERWRLDAALDRIDARIAELRRTRRGVVATRADCHAGRCRLATQPGG
jgi:DNA-binding transcriptional MerR regulator